MPSAIIDNQVRVWWRQPALWAVANLLITLYGIVFKNWSLQPIILIFWIEIMLQLASTMVRAAAAFDNRPYWDNIGQRLFALLFGVVMGTAFIMLSVAFTINVFDSGFKSEGFGDVRYQVWILIINYLASLVLHYFLNGRFRSASPVGELASTVVYLLILLAFIMVITQHLAPRYAGEKAALWTGLAVVGVKFVVDWIFAGARKPLRQMFSEND